MFEWLQTRGAEVEGETLEVRSIRCFLGDIRAGAGRVGVGGCPFRMGNLCRVSSSPSASTLQVRVAVLGVACEDVHRVCPCLWFYISFRTF